MRRDHRVRLHAIFKELGQVSDKMDAISSEMAISQKVDPDTVINGFEENDFDNQIVINSKHISNGSGQVMCAMECISEAFDNVRRVK